MAVIDITGIYLFMPVFSFLFVFLIIYAILVRFKILGDSQFVNLLISFIISIFFMSFSVVDLYVRTLIPWFVVLLVCIFLILLIGGFASGKLENIQTNKFMWVVVGILISIILIVSIKVFNPILHPDLVLTSGESGTSLLGQLGYIVDTQVAGSLILLVIAAVVAWVITRAK